MLTNKKVCKFFGVMWPVSLGVRIRGDFQYSNFLDAVDNIDLKKVEEFLLLPGFDVNYQSNFGIRHRVDILPGTAMCKASHKGHIDVVERLLRHTVSSQFLIIQFYTIQNHNDFVYVIRLESFLFCSVLFDVFYLECRRTQFGNCNRCQVGRHFEGYCP